jgi:hypothetical protein
LRILKAPEVHYLRAHILAKGGSVCALNVLPCRLRLEGVPDASLSLARSASALSGIVGTLLYPALAARLGLVRTGLCSIWLQVCQLCITDAWQCVL